MTRFRIELSYDGGLFEGWQSQLSGNTIQDKLEAAILKITGQFSRVHGAGRTDSGVHALSQTAHFDSDSNIPPQQLLLALNSVLPRDISIYRLEATSGEFHARYDAKEKHYDYYIYNSNSLSPFWRHHSCWWRGPLDINAMGWAIWYFIGRHDFTSFCAGGCDIEDRVRTIKYICISSERFPLLQISVVGNGFLRHMVRIMLGTIIAVGSGRRTPEDVAGIIAAKDRNQAGPTAPACGLFLNKVYY